MTKTIRVKALSPRVKYRSKTEERFAEELEKLKKKGKIQDYRHEVWKFKIGEGEDGKAAWYTPDFFVLDKDGYMKIIEVKGGHIYPASLVRYKSAKLLYPFFRWEMHQYKNKQWRVIH